jgi:hypothetical protein
MVYVIEIIHGRNKIINAYKKDQMGVEYACADNLESKEVAIQLIRNRWKHNGVIHLIENNTKTIIEGT